MKINRNNYESFFLLYIDNELSAEEKTEVENFLLKNSDLSDEFDLLRDTKLADEGLTIFEHKELLYKSTALHIDTENCEEWFLLYTDNELSTDEKESVDRWLSNNPTYKPALEVLLHTQMPKETIVFSNKASLYKQEAHRVVSLAPRRWMAAASIAILLTGGWFLWNSKNTIQQDQTASNTNEISKKIEPTYDTKNVTGKTASISSKDSFQKQLLNTTIQAKTTNKKINDDTIEQYVNVKENNIDNSIVTNNSDHAYETISVEAINTTEADNNSIIAANNLSDDEMNETINSIVTAAINEKVQTNTDADIAMLTNASNSNHYTVLQTDDDKNNLYVGALNLNKNKLKGIIRKAGKIFSDKTKNIADINGDIIKSTSGSIKK